jgi:predicted RNA-binding protein with PUA-like domain
MKTEPETFGWDNIIKDGKATWDGVRNYQARNNLAAMKKGDLAFIYLSVQDKAVVGIAKVSKEAFPDPTIEDPRWLAVEVVPKEKLPNPVSLATVKADERLQKMFLVTHSRLSVQPVTKEEFDIILQLAQKS